MQESTNPFKKLNNHRLPIDESYWAEMEKRLQNNRRKVVPSRAWLAVAGIAASLALLITVRMFNADNENVGTQMTRIDKISADKNTPESTQMTQTTPISADNAMNKESCTLNNPKSKNPRKSALSASSACNKNIPPAPENDEEPYIADVPEVEQDTLIQKYEKQYKQYSIKPDYDLFAQNEPIKRKPQQKKSLQLAAAFGSGTSNFGNDLSFSNDKSIYSSGNRPNGDYSLAESPGLKSATPTFDEIFYQFPEVTHLPPLSFGLTVRKNFNNRFAFETGLTYSFLHSKFNDDTYDWLHRDATLELHYLGIPLNAVTYLVNNPQWNIYFSPGVMVEKGIKLDYVQHKIYKYNYDQPVHTVRLEDKISELQWSLNASFGIDYKFYRNIGIYFEPRVIYYLKNNQPISARTEMPLLVGVNAGVRFDF